MLPEGWQETPLGLLLEKMIDYRGKSVPKSETGVPLITAKNIKKGYLDLTELEFVPEEKYDEWMSRGLPDARDILFTTEAPLGSVCRFPKSEKYAIGQRTVALRVNKKLDSEYLLNYLLSEKGSRNVEVRATGSTAKGIKSSELKKVVVAYPESRKEQAAISSILSTWDQAIETTEKLIENSKAQKKALMQQLLTGKKRYSQFIKSSEKQKTKYGDVPLDWLFQPISDIAWERNERAGINSELPVLACSKYAGFVDSLRYFKKKVYSDDTSNYKIVRRGCYGFPSNHIEEGSIGYQNICDAGMVSPIYSVFETSDRVHDGYLFRLLKTDHYRQIFQAYTSASVDRRGSLRWKEFSKIHVPVPSLAEQQRVAETIDTADKDLTNLKAQLLQLQAQKRGLMQQLLTGKRRVTLD